MSWYERRILPRLIHWTCGVRPIRRQREKVVPGAAGEVLELGFGSGANLPFYDRGAVTRVWALEPSPEMWRLAEPAVRDSAIPVEFLEAPAEEVPLPDGSVDCVLATYTLCSVPDVGAAMREARRVLRPGGRVIFCEHGRAPDAGVERWQNRLDPVWRRFSGGCHLNRSIPELIEGGGFQIESLSTLYLPGWRPASYNYWGTARAG
jgi:ubiquinone/menaquinone biosynthesis C-methylase UbiE